MRSESILITGGSSGIGASMAAAIASTGRRIAIVSRRRRPAATEIACRWGAPERVDWIEADLAEADQVRTSVTGWCETVAEPPGGLFFCAASYGYGSRHSVLATSVDEWDQVLAVNLRAQYIMTSVMLPHLVKKRQGLIVSVTSSAAMEAAPGRAHYAASKAGALALLRALAEELKDTGVSVVQVMPKNQVVTPGLKARRPPGYSFDDYDPPSIFSEFSKWVLAGPGHLLNGRIFAVGRDGGWEEVGVRGG